MMLGFVEAHRREYGVEPICKVLPTAPSTVRQHTARAADPAKLSARAQRDVGLKTDIRRVFDENFQVYGVRKVWRQLQREGIQVARCTVARLMREMGLRGAIRGKPIKTTIADKAVPCPLDRVNRQFRADRPDQLWLSDFTHVSTWSGFVYVAFIIDAFARRIVGWRVSRTAETVNGLYKAEVIHRRGPWKSFEAVEYATLKWVDWFNNRRLLEPIGNIPPAEAEQRYHDAVSAQKLAA
ncbi:Integrase core domain-containing protein [Azospirillum sp. RU38E]|nr:Integrase core domain-containing protein [Azospirillum sp. RU38E]SNT23649.1 Integrase core domain-containing protein [Azospirillum sp. RU37A]